MYAVPLAVLIYDVCLETMGVASGPANSRVSAVGVLVPRLSVEVVGSTASESACIFTGKSRYYETYLGNIARATALATCPRTQRALVIGGETLRNVPGIDGSSTSFSARGILVFLWLSL